MSSRGPEVASCLLGPRRVVLQLRGGAGPCQAPWGGGAAAASTDNPELTRAGLDRPFPLPQAGRLEAGPLAAGGGGGGRLRAPRLSVRSGPGAPPAPRPSLASGARRSAPSASLAGANILLC